MRIGVARVQGRSMLPGLRPGDRLLVQYDVAPRPGALVIARLPGDVVAVKRVESLDEAGVWLCSDNAAEGWSSRRQGGPVAPSDVRAVVRLRLWPRPRVIRRTNP